MKPYPASQLTPELKRRCWSEKVNLILNKITKTEAKLHMIRFYGSYNNNSLQDKIGPLNDQTEQSWNSKYKKRYIRNFPDFLLEAFVHPWPYEYMPECIISISPQNDISIDVYKEFLKDLHSRLPSLNVSAVEYALDLFCLDPAHVTDLFRIILKCLYVPYQKNVYAFGGRPIIYALANRLNYGCRIGNAHKVYERAPDCKRQLAGWTTDTLDRVRLEYTAKNAVLKKFGLYRLQDLIVNPKFADLNEKRWQFKCFNSAKPPAPYAPYLQLYGRGNLDSFQHQYLESRGREKNISQYLEDLIEFKSLESDLKKAIVEFDGRWCDGKISWNCNSYNSG